MKTNIINISARLYSLVTLLLIGSMFTCMAQQKRITMDLNYDKTNQLLSEKMNEYYDTGFTYDVVGNRTTKSTISYTIDGVIFVPSINGEVTIYPNPVKSFISVKYELQTRTLITYSIITIDGRVIYDESIFEGLGKIIHRFDVSKYPSGAYILKISTKKEKQSALKFIIDRP